MKPVWRSPIYEEILTKYLSKEELDKYRSLEDSSEKILEEIREKEEELKIIKNRYYEIDNEILKMDMKCIHRSYGLEKEKE